MELPNPFFDPTVYIDKLLVLPDGKVLLPEVEEFTIPDDPQWMNAGETETDVSVWYAGQKFGYVLHNGVGHIGAYGGEDGGGFTTYCLDLAPWSEIRVVDVEDTFWDMMNQVFA